jgi:hypothetical protein
MKRWHSSSIRLSVLVSAFVFAACQDVSITTVPVERLVIEPGSATVQVNGTVLLNATPVADNGQPLPGRRVSWVSLNEAVATVDATGLVRGVATGTAIIRAESEGASADADVVVTIGPAIVLSSASLTFSGAVGGASPAPQQVAITNGGGGSLMSLSTTVEYTSAQTGWLAAILGGTTAPTVLTLSATTGALPAGSHTARVLIASPVAANTPQQVTVTFNITEVTAPPGGEDEVPDVPGNVAATPESPTQVRVSWTPPGSQTYYEIRRRTGGGGQWTFETTVAGDQTTWLDSGLTPDTNYQYQIRACSPAGCSQYSSQVTARTPPS